MAAKPTVAQALELLKRAKERGYPRWGLLNYLMHVCFKKREYNFNQNCTMRMKTKRNPHFKIFLKKYFQFLICFEKKGFGKIV